MEDIVVVAKNYYAHTIKGSSVFRDTGNRLDPISWISRYLGSQGRIHMFQF